MKKFALVVALAAISPMSHASTIVVTESFDLWGWLVSLFEPQNAGAANAESSTLLESVQDEARSFNSIIR